MTGNQLIVNGKPIKQLLFNDQIHKNSMNRVLPTDA